MEQKNLTGYRFRSGKAECQVLSGYEGADAFLLGHTSPVDFSKTGEKVERKIVIVPGTDNLVIVYDQLQEDHYVNVKFPEQYAEHA